MDSIAQQPKRHGGRRHGHPPRSARKRISSRKSAAQQRAMDTTDRLQVRAELRALRLTGFVG
ncbi:hypothetical protein ACFZC6_16580 [Streptomyces ossamyceticus]|uniref:hypothetical protein n=1 Tax=Streptomyces ossamyceticus TaxID=249581 RepID=UPI0036E6C747